MLFDTADSLIEPSPHLADLISLTTA